MSKNKKNTLVIIAYVGMLYDDGETVHDFGSMPIDFLTNKDMLYGRELYDECVHLLEKWYLEQHGDDMITVNILAITKV